MINLLTAVMTAAERYWRDGHMDGDWLWMALAMAVLWATVIVLLVWLFRSGGGVTVRRHETAHEILRRRLAEGEISVEEFENRRKAMRDSEKP